MSGLICRRVFFAIASALLASPAFAESSGTTVVTVKEMCGGCLNQIGKRLEGFPGISTVSCDITTKTVTITPQAKTTVAPKALWEALDGIGKTPVKMVTPQGTFTSKPQ